MSQQGLPEQTTINLLAREVGAAMVKGHHCSRLAVLRLGSVLGSGTRADGPRSVGLAGAKSFGPPTATGWGHCLACGLDH